jgi:hypothetical protein
MEGREGRGEGRRKRGEEGREMEGGRKLGNWPAPGERGAGEGGREGIESWRREGGDRKLKAGGGKTVSPWCFVLY